MKHWLSLRQPLHEPGLNLQHLLNLADRAGRIVSVFDIETTGYGVGITEVAVLYILPAKKAINGHRLHTASSLIDPEHKLNRHVVALTGITEADVKDQLTFPDSWLLPLRRMLRDDIVIGFNSKGDITNIVKEAARYGHQLERSQRHIDLRTLANNIHGTNKGKLVEYCAKYGISPRNGSAHRALVDVLMTAELGAEIIHRHNYANFNLQSKLECK